MFGWFKSQSKISQPDPLCAMCNRFKPVKSDMGDDFCFTCLVDRFKEATGTEQKIKKTIEHKKIDPQRVEDLYRLRMYFEEIPEWSWYKQFTYDLWQEKNKEMNEGQTKNSQTR